MLTGYETLKSTSKSSNISEEAHKKINLMKYLYQDTSLQKSILIKEKIDFERTQLILKQKVLSNQTAVRNNAIAKRTLQEKWDELKIEKLKYYLSLKQLEDNAAITIQRHVRGFLLRIKVEDKFINFIEDKSTNLITSSTAQALNIMLNLGVVLVPATVRIQKAFKRYLIRKKVHRLQHIYKVYLQLKAEAAGDFLKSGIRCLINIKILEHLKFLKYRTARLEQIKSNLSILKIKNYWKFRKFTFRIIRDKILRVKRRQAALQNKEAFAKYLNSIGGKLERKMTHKLSIGSEEEKNSVEKNDERGEGTQNENEDNVDDEEFLETQRIQELIKKQIQNKVDKGKLSHGIKCEKQVMILPLMQEKALKETPSSESKVFYVTASVFAKGRNLSREVRKPFRSTLIGSPPSCEHKRLPFYTQMPYMRALFTPEPELRRPSPTQNIDYAEFMAPTISFKKKKFRPCKSEAKKRDTDYHPVSPNLIVPTIAYSLKLKQKKTLEKTKNWSFRSENDKYVTSISNSKYSPIPWKPLPLNRNILGNTEYGKGFYREKPRSKYNFIDFNSRVMTPDLPKIGKEENLTNLNFFNSFEDV